ncbi:MAG: hypothetical protein DRP64_01185, partial [Verrucomicrobia bacterium]
MSKKVSAGFGISTNLAVVFATFSMAIAESPPVFSSVGKELNSADLPQGWRVVSGADREPQELEKFDQPITASHLEFLHTFDPGEALHDWRLASAQAHRNIELPPTAPTLFKYAVTYADGEVLEIPVRFGESIEQWYRVHAVGPMLWAKMEWAKDLDPISGEKAVLYKMTWPNPRPGKTIRSIGITPHNQPHLNYGDALLCGMKTLNLGPTGANYYVDPTLIGSDDQPGTFDEPFHTVCRAAEVVKPGDTVYLRRGYYALNRRVEFKDFGYEEGKWLTITAYPGETPVLDAFGILADPRQKPFNPAGTNSAPYQPDAGAIHIHNFDGYFRIQGVHIQRSRFAGISVYSRFRSNASHNALHARFVDVQFNTVDRCNTMSIITHYCDDLRIIGNRICRPNSEQMLYTVPGGLPANADNHAQEGIDLSRNQRFEVAFNEVYGGGKEAIDLISVKQGRVHHNYIHSSLNGIYIDSWTEPIVDVEVDHNYIHNTYEGIPCSTEGSNQLRDFDIHHNIIFESKSAGINISEATYKSKPTIVEGHRIAQNTIDRAGYHADAINWLSSGIRVAGFMDNPNFKDIQVLNNIVTRSAHMPMSTPWGNPEDRGIIISHNLFWPPVDAVPDRLKNSYYPRYKINLGKAMVGEDPRYVDAARGDFRIVKTSPARGAGQKGSDLGALPFGSAWAQGRDWAGHITAYYDGGRSSQPVYIPPGKFTQHRNHLQRPSWFQANRYGSDLQHLPAGKQSWAGVCWNIPEDNRNDEPTVLTLTGMGFELKADRIDGIPVGRKASALAFLHTFNEGAELKELEQSGEKVQGLELYTYVVHYADGSEETLPVRWLEHTAHWQQARLENLPSARLAWTTPIIPGDRHTALYSYVWPNPQPDVEIVSIDLVGTAPWGYGSPAVLAISTLH